MSDQLQNLSPEGQLRSLIAEALAPLGYECVDLEVHLGRTKKLALFIDHLDIHHPENIGLEDCVKVNTALDPVLDASPEVEEIFKGPYELEVSSPGFDRPLKSLRDFERHNGALASIYVERPLTGEELENPEHAAAHPKQRSFEGRLAGIKDQKIVLSLPPAKKTKSSNSSEVFVTVPLSLITKAVRDPGELFGSPSRKAKS